MRHVAEHPASLLPPDEKVRWLREADEAARAVDPAVTGVVAGYGDSLQRVMIAATDGRLVREDRPRIRLVVQVVASRDGVIQTGFHGPALVAGTEYVDQFPPRETAEKAARSAVAMLDGVPAPAGEMPVVIGPGGGGVLFHEACGHGLEADLIQKESSIYRGRIGELLATPLLNGVDDATVPNAWGSFSFDDEGWPSQRTVLFTEGVLEGYMYDRIRAERDGVPSSGNGRRQSYAHLPIPRMTNTYILAGEATADQVVADTAEGVLREEARRRPGEPRDGRLRVRRDRGLPDRERRDHQARPRRQPRRERHGRSSRGSTRSRTTSTCSTGSAARRGRASPWGTAARRSGSRG